MATLSNTALSIQRPDGGASIARVLRRHVLSTAPGKATADQVKHDTSGALDATPRKG